MLNRMRARLTVALAMIALFSFAAGQASAQSTAATLSGTVRDASGASVPNAAVTIASPETRETRTVQTNDSGLFVAPDVTAGTYDVSIEKTGFRRAVRTGVVVSPQDRLSLGTIALEVGSSTESITITADAGQLQLQSDSGERSAAVNGAQLRDLALNGRNIHDLAKLIPGVAQPGGANQQSNLSAIGSYSINGLRVTMKDMAIDGSSITRTDQQAQQVTINPDAVGEIRILTSNYQAEYGKAGGGVISVTTKEGTKDFHGSARYFRRHDSLNANTFFNDENGRPRGLYRYNYYGYDIGGPIFLPKALGGFNQSKNKLFFFWNQEYYRQLIPVSANNIEVPTALERNGDFSQSVDGNGKPFVVRDGGNCLGGNTGTTATPFPGNVIPKSCFFPGAQAILNLMPLPNTTIGGNQYNYTSQISNRYPRREDIVRVDYLMTPTNRLSGRFINNYDDQILAYGTTTLSDNFPIGPVNRSGSGYNLALTLTSTLSPTLINEAIFGHGVFTTNIEAGTNAFSRAVTGISTPLLFPNANGSADVIPSLSFGGLTNQTAPSIGVNGSPFLQSIPSYNIIDNVTKIIGKHTAKVGFYFYRSTSANTPQQPTQSTIDFTTSLGSNANFPLDTGNPFANALTGVYNSYTQASAKVATNSMINTVEGYLQDTWRVTSHFTLDFGLRFSWLDPLHDTGLQEGYFVPSKFDPAKAVRLYAPVLVSGQVRVVDPANAPTTPTVLNTLPNNFLGLIVPNSGDPTNGIVYAKSGYLTGGFAQGVRAAPRFGFAWSPAMLKDTVVRGGFGIAYDRSRADQTSDESQVPPNVLIPQLFYGDLRNINASSANGARGVPNLTSVSPTDTTPNVYSYSLGIQRNLGYGLVLDVAYVGTLGRNLLAIENINSVPYLTTFQSSAQDPTKYANGVIPAVEPNLPAAYANAGLKFSGVNALSQNFVRPYAGYGDINYRVPGTSSNYNSLQVSLNRHLSHSLVVGLAYTYSKNFVVANTDSDTVNPVNVRAYEYRLAGSDQTHNMVISYVYDLPSTHFMSGNAVARAVLDGWEISGISTFRTGTPTELSPSISGIAGQRLTGSYTLGPNFYVRSNPLVSANVDGDHIDANSLYIGNPGNLGPWPRTYFRNPGTNNFDISIFKNFYFGERKHYLQLRLEAFNAFNHTQFSGYNTGTNLTSGTGATGAGVLSLADYSTLTLTNNLRPAGSARPLGTFFGEYNATRDPRIVQLAAKFYF
jgi:hypothetical protein